MDAPPKTPKTEIKTADSFKLLAILPLEIWVQTFNMISNPSHLENCCNASDFFRRLLYSRRVVFLFPRLWSIVGRRYHNLCRNKKVARSQSRRYFDCAEILKLRRVCRCYCDTIDEFYQSGRHYFQLPGDPREKLRELKDRAWTEETISYHVNRYSTRFLRFFKNTHSGEDSVRSPFLGRAVTISYMMTALDDVHDPTTHFHQFLVKYGRHIWYCTININDVTGCSATCYRKLSEWLRLLPNLRYLCIRFFSLILNANDQYPNNLAELANEMVSNPLPKLSSLQFLSAVDLPVPIINSLIRINDHVTMLNIEHKGIHWNFDVFSVAPTNLTQMTIKFCSEREFTELESSQVHWPLKKLNLTIDKQLKIEWTRIFKLLESRWGNTMTNLVIRLPKWQVTGNSVKKSLTAQNFIKLNLPFVKSLKVKMSNVLTLDFLLPLKDSLEVLRVKIKYDNNQKLDNALGSMKGLQHTHFVGFTDDMMKSNIWKVFPNLKHLFITETVIFKKCMLQERRTDHFSYKRQNS